MRSCYIVSGLGVGGAEFSLLRLCRALPAFGVESSVISLSGMGELGARFERQGTQLLPLSIRGVAGPIQLASRVKSHLRQLRPHVVHGWMYHGNIVASLLGRIDGSNRPVLWSIRQSLFGNRDKASTRVAIRISALLSPRPDAISYNSRVARLQHEAEGFAEPKGVVIPNGFDLDEFIFDQEARARVRATIGIPANSIVIGHVARFHPSKDHVGFLRAFARLHPQDHKLFAVLAGRGVDPENVELKGLAAQLGVSSRVVLLGSRTDISALMSSFDVYCSSSSGMEGFPNVVAEAMSCGVPCVATDSGDTREVVGEFGEVVPPSDVIALSGGLERMVRKPKHELNALGSRGRNHIASRFSLAGVALRHRELYESLIEARSRVQCAA